MNNTGTQADIQQENYELYNIHLYLLGRDGFQGQRKGQQLMGLGIVKNDGHSQEKQKKQVQTWLTLLKKRHYLGSHCTVQFAPISITQYSGRAILFHI